MNISGVFLFYFYILLSHEHDLLLSDPVGRVQSREENLCSLPKKTEKSLSMNQAANPFPQQIRNAKGPSLAADKTKKKKTAPDTDATRARSSGKREKNNQGYRVASFFCCCCLFYFIVGATVLLKGKRPVFQHQRATF